MRSPGKRAAWRCRLGTGQARPLRPWLTPDSCGPDRQMADAVRRSRGGRFGGRRGRIPQNRLQECRVALRPMAADRVACRRGIGMRIAQTLAQPCLSPATHGSNVGRTSGQFGARRTRPIAHLGRRDAGIPSRGVHRRGGGNGTLRACAFFPISRSVCAPLAGCRTW